MGSLILRPESGSTSFKFGHEIDNIGITLCNVYSWTRHIGLGESVHNFFPCRTTICCFINRGILTSIVKAPRLSSKGPHTRIHDSWIFIFHGKICTACIFVYIQNFIPSFSTICGFKYASFFIGAPFFSEGTNTGGIGIITVYYDAFYSFCFFETKMFPRVSTIDRTVNTPTIAHTISWISFTSSHPKHVFI